jgi:hypothetical protein
MPTILSNPLAVVALIVLAFFAISFLPGFLAALFEKRMVWPYQAASEFQNEQATARESATTSNPYAPPSKQDRVPITSYSQATCLRLESLGWSYHNVFYDRRRGLYKLRYDFWLSPDRLVLALVGGGTLAGIPVAGSSLFTRLADGHCLLTIDEPKSQDSDPSGLTLQKIVTHADLEELIAQHRGRFTESESSGSPYSARTPLDDHRAFRTRRADVLIDAGLGRYVDEERNGWKYTLRGAWTAVSSMYMRELKRQLKEPGKDRVARQGEKGYLPGPARSGRGVRIIQQLEFCCWIAMIMGFVLMRVNGPAANRSQLMFRLAIPPLALVSLVLLKIIKRILIRQEKAAVASTWEPDDADHELQ